MKIDWNGNYIEFATGPMSYQRAHVHFESIRSVEKMVLTYGEIRLPIVLLNVGINKYQFFYSDKISYDAMLYALLESVEQPDAPIRQHAQAVGVTHYVWNVMFWAAAKKFDRNGALLIDSMKLDKGDFTPILENQYPFYTGSLEEDFRLLTSLLPENIGETRRQRTLALQRREEQEKARREELELHLQLQREAELKQQYIEAQQRADLHEGPTLEAFLETLDRLDLPTLDKHASNIEADIRYWEVAQAIQAVDETWLKRRLSRLQQGLDAIRRVYPATLRRFLSECYGSIRQLKVSLLNAIVRKPSLEETRQLKQLYSSTGEKLRGYMDHETQPEPRALYAQYVDFYDQASIFITMYLQENFRSRVQRVTIPPVQEETALKYFYETDTVEDALERKKQKDYIEQLSYGDKSETELDYALDWVLGDYIRLKKAPSGKYCQDAIVLNNPALIDDPQEFGQLLAGPQGLFSIESLNYSGKLIIDANGNWIRVRSDGYETGERSAFQTIRRHERVLQSILGEDVPVITVLVMTNPRIILEGVEHFPRPLIKVDHLEEFIGNYQNGKSFSAEEVRAIADKLEQFRSAMR